MIYQRKWPQPLGMLGMIMIMAFVACDDDGPTAPDPTAIPSPSATFVPTSTPEPTATPELTPTSSPKPPATPTPAPRRYEGTSYRDSDHQSIGIFEIAIGSTGSISGRIALGADCPETCPGGAYYSTIVREFTTTLQGTTFSYNYSNGFGSPHVHLWEEFHIQGSVSESEVSGSWTLATIADNYDQGTTCHCDGTGYMNGSRSTGI